MVHVRLSYSRIVLILSYTIQIILHYAGYLAETPEQYAAAILRILQHPDAHIDMIQRARGSVDRFSDEKFSRDFVREINSVL